MQQILFYTFPHLILTDALQAVVNVTSFHWEPNWGSENLKDLPSVTGLGSSRSEACMGGPATVWRTESVGCSHKKNYTLRFFPLLLPMPCPHSRYHVASTFQPWCCPGSSLGIESSHPYPPFILSLLPGSPSLSNLANGVDSGAWGYTCFYHLLTLWPEVILPLILGPTLLHHWNNELKWYINYFSSLPVTFYIYM